MKTRVNGDFEEGILAALLTGIDPDASGFASRTRLGALMGDGVLLGMGGSQGAANDDKTMSQHFAEFSVLHGADDSALLRVNHVLSTSHKNAQTGVKFQFENGVSFT